MKTAGADESPNPHTSDSELERFAGLKGQTWGCAAALFGGLCFVAVVVAVLVGPKTTQLSVVGSCSAGVLLSKVIVDLIGRRLAQQSIGVITSTGVILIAIAFGANLWSDTAAALEYLQPVSPLEAQSSSTVFWAMARTAFVFLLAGFLGVAAGQALVHFTAVAAFRGWALRAAIGSSCILVGLVLIGAFRVWRYPPLPERVGRLEELGFVSPPGVRSVGGSSYPTFGRRAPGKDGEQRHEMEGVTVVMRCGQQGCRLGIVSGVGQSSSQDDVVENAPLHHWDEFAWFLRDPVTEAVLVTFAEEPYPITHYNPFPPPPHRVGAQFQLQGGRYVPVPFHTTILTNHASPSVGWLLCGLSGLVLVAVAWVVHIWISRHWRWVDKSRAGVPGADWIVVDHGPTVQADLAADLRTHLEWKRVRVYWGIVALASLSGAPLAAAAAVGLLG